MSRTKNTVRNISAGLINKVVMLLFPFVIRTILIKHLGSDYLGLSSLFTSILQVLNLTELGFSSAIVYSMYKPLAEKDTKTICTLMNFYKKIYRIIGLIIIIFGMLLIPFLPKLIHGSYPETINITILYLIYLFNTGVTYFLFAYKSSLLNADQRNDIINNVNTIVGSVQYIMQIIILIVFKNYYAYIIVQTLANIINNIAIAYITSKYYPNYTCAGDLSNNQKKDIKKRVFGLMIQKICQTTRNSFDSIFISAFFGLNIVAIYNNYYSIMFALNSLVSIILTSMLASIGNSIAREKIEKNYNDLTKFDFGYMWLSGWLSICLFCLFQPFMKIWMGNNYLLDYSSVILFCLYFYALKMGDIRSLYVEAMGLWFENRYRALMETFLNLVLNYFLGRVMGLNGIIIATFISLFLINFLYGSNIIFKYYFKNYSVWEYFKYHFKYFSVTAIIGVITFIICTYVPHNGIMKFILCGIICFVIPNLFYFIVYHKDKNFRYFKNLLLEMGKMKNE